MFSSFLMTKTSHQLNVKCWGYNFCYCSAYEAVRPNTVFTEQTSSLLYHDPRHPGTTDSEEASQIQSDSDVPLLGELV